MQCSVFGVLYISIGNRSQEIGNNNLQVLVVDFDMKTQAEFYGVPIIIADRNMVESEAEQIYLRAQNEDIAFLVVGDPLW